jgi:hypothetical protein
VKFTAAFSISAPPSSTHGAASVPPGSAKLSRVKRAPPSSASSAAQMRACSSTRYACTRAGSGDVIARS